MERLILQELFALGELTPIQKKHFTMVLQGMLALQMHTSYMEQQD